MSIWERLPLSESFGVFVGVSGFDWLTEGHADPIKALITAGCAGGILVIARACYKTRDQ